MSEGTANPFQSVNGLQKQSKRVYSIAEQQQKYITDGYLHVKRFFSVAEMAKIAQFTQEVQSTPERVGGQMMWFEKSGFDNSRILNRVEDFSRIHEGMASFFTYPDAKLVHFVEELVQKKLVLFKDKINFKLPGGGGFKAHQDQAAGWGKYIQWFINVGVFVDRATIRNGCLEVAAGYHTQGLLGQEWQTIENLDLPYEFVECDVGDIIVFDSYVPHRSAENMSNKDRRVIFLTYNVASEGDKRDEYFADKRLQFPPDIEREDGKEYIYRV